MLDELMEVDSWDAKLDDKRAEENEGQNSPMIYEIHLPFVPARVSYRVVDQRDNLAAWRANSSWVAFHNHLILRQPLCTAKSFELG